MRLHRLRLTDFRGIRDLEVPFADNGITVVLADNEAGKSSLLEAFRLLFSMRDDSQHRDIRAVRPTGRDVGSTVEASLDLGGHDVVYRKTWFRERETVLAVDGRTIVGRDAHDAAAALFSEHVDDHLWESLVVGQAESLRQPVPRAVGPLLGVLSGVTDADHSEAPSDGPSDGGRAGESFTFRVEKEYRRYFTAGMGRPTGELATAEAELELAEKHAVARRESIDVIDRTVEEAQRLDVAGSRLRAEKATNDATVADLVHLLDEAERCDATRAQARDAAELARLRQSAALAAATGRARDRAALDALEGDLAARAAMLVDAERALTASLTALAAATQAREPAATDVSTCRAALADWHRRAEHNRAVQSLRVVEDTLRAATESAAAADRHTVAADEILATRGMLDLVEQLAQQTALAHGRLEAATPTVTVRRTGSAPVTLMQADNRAPIDPGGQQVVAASEKLVVQVGDAAEITVAPPAGVDELRRTAAAGDAQLAEALAELGCDRVDDVRSAVRRREELERASADARASLRAALGRESMASLESRRDALAAMVAADPADADDRSEQDSDGPCVELGPGPRTLRDLEERVTAAEQALARVEVALVRARATAEDARRDEVAVRTRHDDLRERRDTAVADLAATRATSSDEALVDALAAAETATATAETEFERANAAFDDGGYDTVVSSHAQATALGLRLDHELATVEYERIRAETRLEDAGAGGLASALDEAEADLDHAREHWQVIRRRADAAALLKCTVETHQASAQVRYADPLKQKIEQFGRIAFGPTFEVRLGDDLDVVERSLDGRLLPVESLSTGAKEQLAIVVRLAIAAMTGRDGQGVPLILDDVLGWSDPTRLEHMQRLLGEVADGQQLIVLTSQWDRYRHVPGIGAPVRLAEASVG